MNRFNHPGTHKQIHLALSCRKSCTLMVSSLLLILASFTGQTHALELNEAAPGVNLESLAGEESIALASFQGQVVYVDFWASWCPPCMRSLPQLNELYNELKDQGFVVYAINLDVLPADARAFLQRQKVDYPVVRDSEEKTPLQFGLEAMPTGYLLDRQHRLRYRHVGFKNKDIDKIRQQVLVLLRE